MGTRWVRRKGDALAEWHMIPRGARAPSGVVIAACGLALGDDEANLERRDEALPGGRCGVCQGIVLRWG